MNKRLVTTLIVPFVLLLFGVSLMTVNIASSQNLTTSELSNSISEADLVVIYDEDATTNINVDGLIGVDEYPESFYSEYTKMTVSIVHNGSFIFVGLEAQTTGYLAIGINKEGLGMVGADIKFGYVNSEGITVNDYYAKVYGFPSQDPTGDSDIVNSAGTEENGKTVVEMVFRMKGTDLEPDSLNVVPDKEIKVNNSYSLLYAWGRADGMSLHQKKAIYTMFIAPEGVAKRNSVKTSFELDVTTGDKNTTFSGTATLTDNLNTNLEGKQVTLYLKSLISDVPIETGVTDSSGKVIFKFTIYQEYQSTLEVYVKFEGDLVYKQGQSNIDTIAYNGEPEKGESAEFLVFPESLDYLVPYITGFGALAIVASLWMTFVYVIYTVLFLNARDPNGKEENGGN